MALKQTPTGRRPMNTQQPVRRSTSNVPVKKRVSKKCKRSPMARILRFIGGVIGLLFIILFLCVAVIGGTIGYLTIREYEPASIVEVDLEDEGEKTIAVGDSLSILSWNTGFGALDKNQDYYLYGGNGVGLNKEDDVRANVSEISKTIKDADADVVFLQEVDKDSKRSAHVDQVKIYKKTLKNDSLAYAKTYDCDLVPEPAKNFLGEVESGLVTLNTLVVEEAERVKLPEGYEWPQKTYQSKMALLVERVPIENSSRELVLINVQMEGYEDDVARRAELKVLADVMKSEYAKGNYCIAGGDFNQIFPDVDSSNYAVKNKNYFKPEKLNSKLFGDGWNLVTDDSTATARLLNEPYKSKSGHQLYVLDGFITSPNVSVNLIETLDEGFKYSDHNPVKINVTLVNPNDVFMESVSESETAESAAE